MTDQYLYLLVKAILTLVFVLGLLGASLYALKYYMRRSGAPSRPQAPLKVLNTLFLGQKRNLSIVEAAGEILVLGITPTTITCLTKIESPTAIESIRKLEATSGKSILGLLQKGF